MRFSFQHFLPHIQFQSPFFRFFGCKRRANRMKRNGTHLEWKLVVWATKIEIILFCSSSDLPNNFASILIHSDLCFTLLVCVNFYFFVWVCVAFGFYFGFFFSGRNQHIFFIHSIPSRMNSICCLLTQSLTRFFCIFMLCIFYAHLLLSASWRRHFFFLSLCLICAFCVYSIRFWLEFHLKTTQPIKQLWLICHTSLGAIVGHFQWIWIDIEFPILMKTFLCVCFCTSDFLKAQFSS